MKKSTVTTTVANYIDQLNAGEIDFDYPIQRNGGQWNDESASLLMHSFMADYPVPPVYALVNKIAVQNEDGDDVEQDVYSILDGKQRLTYVQRFVNNDLQLHESTPPVTIAVGRGKLETIEIANEYFESIDERVKKSFLNAELSMVQINSATEEEIENIFFRLNNGQALTKTQQGKSVMGSEWAQRLTAVSKHPTITTNAQFTPLQKKKADDEIIAVQTMMIMDSLNGTFEMKSISSNHVFDYIKKFKTESERLLPFYEKVIEGLDYLHEAYENFQEKLALKKVHITATIMTALHAKEKGIAPIRFRDWTAEFDKSYKGKGDYIKTKYKTYSQQGTVLGSKALGRVEEMIKHFDTYIEQSKQENVELVEAIEQVKESLGGEKTTETVEVEVATTETAPTETVEVEVEEKPVDKKDKKGKKNPTETAEEKPSTESDEVQITLDNILG